MVVNIPKPIYVSSSIKYIIIYLFNDVNCFSFQDIIKSSKINIMSGYPYGFVAVLWTNWIDIFDKDDEHCNAKECLYMYATRKEPLYIGAAGHSTVIKRFNDKLNQKRGAVQWINK